MSSSPPMLLCCGKLYISEARNKSALESIERAAERLFPEVAIVNKFEDETYNRVAYTLVSKSSDSLKKAVFSMAKAAYEAIDFDLHTGSHPRLGVVDHICFHPLAPATSLQQVAIIARAVAKDIGSILKVPCYTYGAAHKEQRSVDAIRRELGYYKPNAAGQQWSGGPKSAVLPVEAEEGPGEAVKAKGVVVIGASEWVATYNVPVLCTDIGVVRRIARRVSGRGGGIASVQAIALVHGDDDIEVACNLVEPSVVSGEQVQLVVEELGKEASVKVGKGYYTDLSPDHLIQTYFNLTSPSS